MTSCCLSSFIRLSFGSGSWYTSRPGGRLLKSVKPLSRRIVLRATEAAALMRLVEMEYPSGSTEVIEAARILRRCTDIMRVLVDQFAIRGDDAAYAFPRLSRQTRWG